MRRRFYRSVPIPLQAALTVAVLTSVALLMVAALFYRIDTTARELRAAEAAEREFSDLAEKLPGLTEDPELAEMGRAALADLADVADLSGQRRVVEVRADGEATADWPAEMSAFGSGFVQFSDGAGDFAGVVRTLGDGSEVLVAYPVPSTGPLTAAFLRWGVLLAIVIVAIAGLVAWITGVAISRRIAELNALCERVERGEVTARHAIASTDEIDVLAGHMNRMLDELQRRLEALRDTTDGLAHDLRTPLARVQGRISRLEELVEGGRTEAEVHLAAEELSRLMDAFNALLELREIEAEGPVPAQPFAVEEAVENAIDLYEAVAEDERGIRIARQIEPCEAEGNASLIVRAVANLIDNAIKASSKHATIVVWVTCESDEVVIAVQDSGVGLAQSGDKRSTLGGHGIGLRIVRAVMRRHGGRFTLTDCAPGARAELRLPRNHSRQVS